MARNHLTSGSHRLRSRARVGVGVVEVHRLVLVGGRVPVVHQGEVGADPVAEPLQLQVPVEPPARVLLAEQDHQQRREEQQPAGAGRRHHRRAVGGPLPRAAGDGAQHDQDRDRHEDAEERGQPIERPVRVVDRELHRVGFGCILLPFRDCLRDRRLDHLPPACAHRTGATRDESAVVDAANVAVDVVTTDPGPYHRRLAARTRLSASTAPCAC